MRLQLAVAQERSGQIADADRSYVPVSRGDVSLQRVVESGSQDDRTELDQDITELCSSVNQEREKEVARRSK